VNSAMAGWLGSLGGTSIGIFEYIGDKGHR
jgi:hypothetical protein